MSEGAANPRRMSRRRRRATLNSGDRGFIKRGVIRTGIQRRPRPRKSEK